MSDPAGDRPERPRYGEYATPEEQRARIRVPDPAVLPTEPAVEPATPVATGQDPSRRGGRVVDRLVTWGLLGYGLVTVLSSMSALVDYGSYAETFLGILGVDAALSDPGAGRGWGIAASAVMAIGWIVVAVLSWRNLRAGRISFWIPLVGGLLCNMIAGVLMIVPIMSDPAVWDAVTSSLG